MRSLFLASFALLSVVLSFGSTADSAATVAAPRDGLIAFMRPGKLGKYDIWVVRPNGTGLRRLTTTPKNHTDYGPAWSPNGSTVVFERRELTEAGSENLYTIPADAGKLKQLTDCSGDCWADFDGRYSPDGSSIVFVHATGPRAMEFPSSVAVYVMNADGSDIRQLTDPPESLEDHLPSWSPDGKTIVFQRDTSTSPAGPTKLLAIDVESRVERLVYAIPRWAPGSGNATFSPDGKRILFGYWCIYGDENCPSSTRSLRNSRLATVRPDGSGLKVLPIKLRADSAAWSPSGTHIVFRCHDVTWGSPFALCTSRPDGTQLKRFPWPLGSAHPNWGTHR